MCIPELLSFPKQPSAGFWQLFLGTGDVVTGFVSKGVLSKLCAGMVNGDLYPSKRYAKSVLLSILLAYLLLEGVRTPTGALQG